MSKLLNIIERRDQGACEVIETGEGFLKAKVTIARPGVFPYSRADGQLVMEAKLPEDILNESTIFSAKGAPVTDGHPVLDGKEVYVTAENYKLLAKGNISEPRIEDGKLVAFETIYDADLIESIKSGEKREVSIGFRCEIDQTPGVYDGRRYDAAQKKIIINHLAHVPRGRGGSEVKIHVDEANKMKYSFRRFDGTDIHVDAEAHLELMAMQKKMKADSAEMDTLKSQLEALQASIPDPKGEADKAKLLQHIETLNAAIDAWKSKYAKLEESVPAAVDAAANEKMGVVDMAKAVDPEMKTDGLSSKDIKLQVIAKSLPFKEGIKLDALSDEIINARYDAACDLLRTKANERKDTQSSETRLDESVIEQKKQALASVWVGTPKK